MKTKQEPKHQTLLAPETWACAFTVTEFCEVHRISRALFYVMARDGRGPAVMKAGRRTLISREAAENWRRRMEAEAA